MCNGKPATPPIISKPVLSIMSNRDQQTSFWRGQDFTLMYSLISGSLVPSIVLRLNLSWKKKSSSHETKYSVWTWETKSARPLNQPLFSGILKYRICMSFSSLWTISDSFIIDAGLSSAIIIDKLGWYFRILCTSLCKQPCLLFSVQLKSARCGEQILVKYCHQNHFWHMFNVPEGFDNDGDLLIEVSFTLRFISRLQKLKLISFYQNFKIDWWIPSNPYGHKVKIFFSIIHHICISFKVFLMTFLSHPAKSCARKPS